MVKSKSDQLSVQHKECGNELMRKNEHFKALCEYNKALLYAESKENLALAYANRSVVYLEIKKYDECLLNIQWARENDYPTEKIQKLNDREEKSKKLKAKQLFDPVEDLHDFFTLSHPPNPKVPFIADCLYLGPAGKKRRRGIFTNQDLKPGDIIAIEKYVFKSVYEDSPHISCCNCLKGNMLNLIPCTKSASLMFCSENCRDETYAKVENLDTVVEVHRKIETTESMKTIMPYGFHPEKILRECDEAFGGRQKLIDFVKEHKLDEKMSKIDCSVFDFDFSNPNDPDYKANLIKCMLSAGTQVSSIIDFFDLHEAFLPAVKQAVGSDAVLEEMLVKLLMISAKRTMTSFFEIDFGSETPVEKKPQTVGLPSFFMHMNHRCNNTSNVYNANGVDGYILTVIKPIKAGEELFSNYRKERDGEFWTAEKGCIAFVNCSCDLCTKRLMGVPEPEDITEEPAALTIASTLTAMQMKFDPRHLISFMAMIDQMKACWAAIDGYYEEFGSTAKTPKTLWLVLGLGKILGDLRFMPCASCSSIYNGLSV